MLSADAEIDNLKAAVARHFSVYGVLVTPVALTFQVTAPEDIDAPFDGLRKELIPLNYVPTIARERGETLVHVQRRPPSRFARREVNVALFVATILTTVVFGGAFNWSGYAGTPLFSAESVGLGAVFFGLPLLLILGAHEMGHYVVARRYHVRASLPFFIPSFPPLGTFGAFISMRDPIPSRRALLDIGVSGPLVGFAIAIPVTLAGLALSGEAPAAPSAVGDQAISSSLMFWFLSLFFPVPKGNVLHPLAFAGWVGLFVTAINLLPAGQLDGGHVARALLGRNQHYLSWAAIFALFLLGTLYFGWVIFGFLILMLGVRHPPPLNDLTRLDPVRKLVGIAAVVILFATFIPQPFAPILTRQDFQFETENGQAIDELTVNITSGGTVMPVFIVNNTGGPRERIGMQIDALNFDRYGWTIAFLNLTILGENTSTPGAVNPDSVVFDLRADERARVVVEIIAPASGPVVTDLRFTINAEVIDTDLRKILTFILNVS